MWEIPTVNAPYRKYFYTYIIQRSFHFGNNEMKAHSKIPKTYGVIWKSHKRCLSHPNLVLIIVLSSSTDPVNLSSIYGRILQKDCLVLDIDAALYRIDTAGVLDNTKVDNRSVVLKLQGSLRIQTWSLTFQKFIRHYHLQDVLKKENFEIGRLSYHYWVGFPGVHYWFFTSVVHEAASDGRHVDVAQDHDGGFVVRSEEFHQHVCVLYRERDGQLEPDAAAHLHLCRLVIRVLLLEVKRHVSNNAWQSLNKTIQTPIDCPRGWFISAFGKTSKNLNVVLKNVIITWINYQLWSYLGFNVNLMSYLCFNFPAEFRFLWL